MTINNEERQDKGQFVQFPIHLIYERKDLSRDDKWVLLAIMGKCWTGGPHRLSYTDIAALADVPKSLLSSFDDKNGKHHEGIIDRLIRATGYIRIVLGREVNHATGKLYKNAQSYIYIDYARIWQENVQYCQAKRPKSDAYCVSDEDYQPVSNTNKVVSNTNNLGIDANNLVSNTNNLVSNLPSNDLTYITEIDSDITDSQEEKESVVAVAPTSPALSNNDNHSHSDSTGLQEIAESLIVPPATGTTHPQEGDTDGRTNDGMAHLAGDHDTTRLSDLPDSRAQIPQVTPQEGDTDGLPFDYDGHHLSRGAGLASFHLTATDDASQADTRLAATSANAFPADSKQRAGQDTSEHITEQGGTNHAYPLPPLPAANHLDHGSTDVPSRDSAMDSASTPGALGTLAVEDTQLCDEARRAGQGAGAGRGGSTGDRADAQGDATRGQHLESEMSPSSAVEPGRSEGPTPVAPVPAAAPVEDRGAGRAAVHGASLPASSPQDRQEAPVVGMDVKPTRSRQAKVKPILDGPPVMPAEDARWNDETGVQIMEARKGRRYGETTRKSELRKMGELRKIEVKPGEYITRQQYEQACDELLDDSWWNEHGVEPMIRHMVKDERIIGLLKTVERKHLRLVSKSTSLANKPSEAHGQGPTTNIRELVRQREAARAAQVQ